MPHFETTITGDGDLVLNNGGGVTGGHCRVEGGFYAGTAVDTNYDLYIKGAAKIDSISNATSDTNKFLVSDGGVVKYRTGAEVLSDIGAIDGSGAATRIAYWSDADTLTSDSGLIYDAGNYLTTTAQVRVGDGAKGSPSYSFDNDRDTGFYLEGTGDIGFTQSGSVQMRINSSGVGVSSDIFHLGDTDTTIGFTTNTITVASGGTDSFDVTNGGTRFLTSTRFTSNATFDDNSKAIFGDDVDLQIYHNGSNSVIEDVGTGDLVIKFSNDLLIEGQDGANLINCNEGNSVQLYYNGSEKLETKSTGIEVTGDVLDRDIPCVLTSNLSDDSSTTSYLFIPFNNNTDSSSNQYYNYFACPRAGKVVSIMLMHVSGSMSSSFTTQLRVTKNGLLTSTSGELTPSNGTSDGSYVEYEPDYSFAKGDRLQFSYQKSAGSKYWRGATATIVIELTDYDI